MANKVKFGYQSGLSLVFTVFDSDGDFRTIEHLPLTETRDTGYYTGNSTVDLTTGDIILVYEEENLLWEDVPLVDTTEEILTWESEDMYWEGEPMVSFDDTEVTTLTWTGEPVGCGEYIDQNNLLVLINNIINGSTTVTSSTDTSYLSIEEELRRALNAGNIGYYELRD